MFSSYRVQVHPVNDNLMEMMVMIDAAKRSSVKRILIRCLILVMQDRIVRVITYPTYCKTCCKLLLSQVQIEF